MREIRISPVFRRKVSAQVAWYLEHCGASFSQTMKANIEEAIGALAHMPTIGKTYKVIGGKPYRMFSSKRKADIIYRYDDKAVYIADIIFTFSKH